MRQRHFLTLAITSILITAPTPGRSAAAPAPSVEACRRAVQGFYDWYVPRLMKEVHVTAMEQSFRTRPKWFSSELRKGLIEDLAAAKKSPDEIVSLDFEPFVNSQDPAPRYAAKKATRTGRTYRVNIHAVIEGKASEQPDVIPELTYQRGQWTFVNFHYPSVEDREPPGNLLKLLKQLRDDRNRAARKKSR